MATRASAPTRRHVALATSLALADVVALLLVALDVVVVVVVVVVSAAYEKKSAVVVVAVEGGLRVYLRLEGEAETSPRRARRRLSAGAGIERDHGLHPRYLVLELVVA